MTNETRPAPEQSVDLIRMFLSSSKITAYFSNSSKSLAKLLYLPHNYTQILVVRTRLQLV